MYISRWTVRGALLLLTAFSLPRIAGPMTGGFDMSSAGIWIIVFALILVAFGQLQKGYLLYVLNKTIIGFAGNRIKCGHRFQDKYILYVSVIPSGYRLELVERLSEDITVYIVTYRQFTAFKLTGELTLFDENEPGDGPGLSFDEVPLDEDARNEMRRLNDMLESTMPDFSRRPTL